MPQIETKQIKNKEYLNWLSLARDWLEDQYGLNEKLAERVSLLLLYSALNGISFRISSGFRDPKKQNELRKRWDAGNQVGLVVRPALNSKHSHVSTILRRPDAKAVDIIFSDPETPGFWAEFFGLGWGGKFRTPDIVHFFV